MVGRELDLLFFYRSLPLEKPLAAVQPGQRGVFAVKGRKFSLWRHGTPTHSYIADGGSSVLVEGARVRDGTGRARGLRWRQEDDILGRGQGCERVLILHISEGLSFAVLHPNDRNMMSTLLLINFGEFGVEGV